jgi:hypothetical protein
MGIWSQQGNKLVGTGAAGNVLQVGSVALSADGNTAIVGGPADGLDLDVKRYAWFRGAAWVYTRRNGVWTQQGSKLVGADVGASLQGRSVALSADGNTAIVGGHGTGAAWVYTCSNGVWTQQGGNLIDVGASSQDWSVALSADGNTAIVGGPADGNGTGAAWVYTHSNGVWTQQGGKLVGTGARASHQGWSVALSGDGNTAVVGGPFEVNGAAWVFVKGVPAPAWSRAAAPPAAQRKLRRLPSSSAASIRRAGRPIRLPLRTELPYGLKGSRLRLSLHRTQKILAFSTMILPHVSIKSL